MNSKKKLIIAISTLIIVIITILFAIQSQINLTNVYKKPQTISREDIIFSTKYLKGIYKSYNSQEETLLIEVDGVDNVVYLKPQTNYMLVFIKSGSLQDVQENIVDKNKLLSNIKRYDIIDINCNIIASQCEAKTVTKLNID